MQKQKLVHLKDEHGKSFTVTPWAFDNVIKKDKGWRNKYDYVGEVDADDVAGKSESAMPYRPLTAEAIADKVVEKVKEEGAKQKAEFEKELSTKEVFSKEEEIPQVPGPKIEEEKNTEAQGKGDDEFLNLEEKENEEQTKTTETTGNGSGNAEGNGKGGNKKPRK